jgi:hypothetical protein
MSAFGGKQTWPENAAMSAFAHLRHQHADSDIGTRYSGFMPANFTTLGHFSVSSPINLPKPEGVSATTASPSWVSRALIF